MEKGEYSLAAAGPHFNPFCEPSMLADNWKVWVRNFQYYIDGQIGLSDKQKISRLLHQAGPDVQEIYEVLKNDEAEGANEYEKCLNRLRGYFEPEKNTVYERQKFRNLTMINGETLDQFAIRLRKQASYCDFSNMEEVIRDQIVEKVGNIDLKRKFIKKGKELTLKMLLEIGRLHELENFAIKEPMSNNSTSEEVNHLSIKCYRCGRPGHLAKSSMCPAQKEKCSKCGIKGHFKNVCKTQMRKERNYESGNKTERKKKKKIVRYVVEEGSSSESEYEENSGGERDASSECENVNSVFSVVKKGSSYKILINGLPCDFIVDSGASVNIVDKNTYYSLCKDVKLDKCTEKYFTYGGRELPTLGMFHTNLSCPETNLSVFVKISVFDGTGPCLLGKDTSEKLNLLRVGPECVMHIENLDKSKILSLYPKLFTGVGKLKKFKLKIHLNPNVPLVAQPARRLPFNMRDIEKDLITELLDNDIIEPVSGPTPCVSPTHIVRKKEPGKYRLVVDMRRANEAVLREHVPLPTFEELLADLNGCKYFSAIDIKWGFHQVELDEESRNITVFNCSLGLYRYKRLFFGIRCAPEIFQRIVSQLLQGIEGVANSQDDIRIGGKTKEEHDRALKQVLDRLQENGITLNKDKCVFGVTEMSFLGHRLSADGIKPTRASKEVIQEFRAPRNKEEVRSFLGLVNFSARFIPNFSTITEPLRKLTKKDTDFIWDQKQQEAFQHLKDVISKAPVLGFYDKNAETYLITDASPVGVAAVLIQKQNLNNQKQPVIIKYASRALTDTERRYSQTEKEALAIVWACENLYMYLLGKKFHIISDHKPLETIYSKRSTMPSARIQRWVLRLQPYTFSVIYKPGKNNIADPLSRLLDINNKSSDKEDIEDSYLLATISENTPTAVTVEEVRKETLKDEHLESLKKAIRNDVWPKELKKYEIMKSELCEVDDVLLRGTRLIIPKALIVKILDIGHEGHLSASSMKAKLRRSVWWQTMDKDIEHWVETCTGCRLVRKTAPPEPIVSTELPSRVWELVAIDYLGPLPSGHYLLVIIDYYSRYYEVEVTKGPSAENTIKILKPIIAREGVMDTLLCDNGPAFRDEGFRKFLQSYGINLRHTTPLWPQANGEVERQNRSILRRLRIAQALKLNWRDELLAYLSAYRTTPHTTTGVPPGELFRGRVIKTKLPEMKLKIQCKDEEIRDKDKYQKQQKKEYADKRRNATESELCPGDRVLIRQQRENKLSTPFSPIEHKVLWKKGNSVAVESPDGKVIRRNSSYFQRIKDRDLSRFDTDADNQSTEENEETMREEGDGYTRKLIQGKERIRKNKEGEVEKRRQTTTDLTLTPTTDVTLPDIDMPETDFDLTRTRQLETRTKRQIRAPAKYKDFVMALILDCISFNQ